jgi:hypothetical protein
MMRSILCNITHVLGDSISVNVKEKPTLRLIRELIVLQIILFIQLMHNWIALKMLKFTLKFT